MVKGSFFEPTNIAGKNGMMGCLPLEIHEKRYLRKSTAQTRKYLLVTTQESEVYCEYARIGEWGVEHLCKIAQNV